MDFKLNETTGDLDLENGVSLVSGATELQQRLKVGLTINLREFFTHQNYGLPWLKPEDSTDDIQYFLGDSDSTVQYIVSTIEDYILSIDQVTDVSSDFSYESNTRTLTYIPTITAGDGEVLDFPPYTLDI